MFSMIKVGKNKFLQNYWRCTYWISTIRPYSRFKFSKSRMILFKTETLLKKISKKNSNGFIFADLQRTRNQWELILWNLISTKINLFKVSKHNPVFSNLLHLDGPYMKFWQRRVCWFFCYKTWDVSQTWKSQFFSQ